MEDLKSKTIQLVYRKRFSSFNSMEELFDGLLPFLKEVSSIHKIEVPAGGLSLHSINRNINFLKNHPASVQHITGHINYLLPFCNGKKVLTIHDIGSLFKGNIIKQKILEFFFLIRPFRKADAITVISEFSRQEILECYPWVASKIRVIPNPVNPQLESSPKIFNTEKPNILHLGTKANKNLENTIRALNDIPCTLTIVGELSKEQLRLLEENAIEYENHVGVPYSAIKWLYEQCDLVAFVSLYEGFGMPIIEAQKVGRPVVTAANGAIPEVAGNSVCYVDADDNQDIRRGILKVIRDMGYRDGLIEAGLENVKRFDVGWVTQQYLDLYNELLEN